MQEQARGRGFARFCSIYLLSALFVLVGTYLTLAEGEAGPKVQLNEVFPTHLAYQFLLLVVLTFLFRIRKQVRDTLILLAILGVFLADGTFLQLFYDWEIGDGLQAGLIGCLSGFVFVTAAALALGIPLASRLTGSAMTTIAFVCLGPAILAGSPEPVTICPRYVWLGWVFALCLLPVFLMRPTDRVVSRLPLRAMELWGVAGFFALGLLHFVAMGHSFNRPFLPDFPLPIYLAPFIIMVTPAIEHLLPHQRWKKHERLILNGLPLLGLFLTAHPFAPALFSRHWAWTWPLTPFYFALLLATGVQLWRAVRLRSLVLRYVAALFAAMACLGTDLPEILARARFPHLVQVGAVLGVAWFTISMTRHLRSAVLLQAVAAFVVAGWMAGLGYPFSGAYLIAMAAGILAIEAITGWSVPRVPRLGLALTVTALPVGLLLAEHSSILRLLVALFCTVSLFVIGWFREDRLLWQVSAFAAAAGVAGYPLAVQQTGDISPGKLIMQLGFILLLVGFLNSMLGGWFREQWLTWWQSSSSSARPGEGEGRAADKPRGGAESESPVDHSEAKSEDCSADSQEPGPGPQATDPGLNPESL